MVLSRETTSILIRTTRAAATPRTPLHAALGPAIDACLDGVPVAKALGNTAPLAAMLGDVQDRIQHAQVGQTDIASLQTQQCSIWANCAFVISMHEVFRITMVNTP